MKSGIRKSKFYLYICPINLWKQEKISYLLQNLLPEKFVGWVGFMCLPPLPFSFYFPQELFSTFISYSALYPACVWGSCFRAHLSFTTITPTIPFFINPFLQKFFFRFSDYTCWLPRASGNARMIIITTITQNCSAQALALIRFFLNKNFWMQLQASAGSI